MALIAERGNTGRRTSPSASTLPPSASTTATAPLWRLSTIAPRSTSTRTGLFILNVAGAPLATIASRTNYTGIRMNQPANTLAAKPRQGTKPRRRRRKHLMLAFLIVFLLPVFAGAGALAFRGGPTHWSDWDRSVTSHLPPAAQHPQ